MIRNSRNILISNHVNYLCASSSYHYEEVRKTSNCNGKVIMAVLLLCICFLSCKDRQDISGLKEILGKKDFIILGGLEGEKMNFIVTQTDKQPLDENYIIIFDKNYKVINFLKTNRSTSNFPVAISERYFAFGCFTNMNEIGQEIVCYRFDLNDFISYRTDYFYIGNIFISNDMVFFSAEKGNPNLNVLKIESQECIRIDKYYLPNASFVKEGEDVYAIQYSVDKSNRYKFVNDNFIKEKSNISSNVKNSSIDDYKIDSSIIQKLKYK